MSSTPLTGEQNYENLQKVWTEKKMSCFKDFLEWYNNKDVEPTLEALQKMISFYHAKDIDMLKIGFTLPTLANRLLHSSTNEKFFPFIEKDKEYDDYIRKWLTGGPSIIFNRYAKAGLTKMENSENVCKSIIGIDATQLYPFSMMQDMPTSHYVKWEFSEESSKFHPRRNAKCRFEQMVLEFYQRKNPHCFFQSQFNGRQKKFGRFSVDGYCAHCLTVVEAQGCHFHFCVCQEQKRLTIDQIEEGEKTREKDGFRREYLQSLGLNVIEVWECEWWQRVRTNEDGAKDFVNKNFPYESPLTYDQLLNKIKSGKLFGVVDCCIEVPNELREKFKRFPPIFKNCEVGREDIGEHMRQFAEEHNLLPQPRRMLISSYKLEKGPLISPLFNFYLEQGLVVKKINWFLQYSPKKCFTPFVNSVVAARREGDTNKNSTVVAETMKLIGNSSYGYQIMDRRKHIRTKYVKGGEVDKLLNNKLFHNLNELPTNLFEVEMRKKVIEHKEPIIVGFFILQYAKKTMLELMYNFFFRFCDSFKYEFIEMDTDSMYLSSSEEQLEELIKPELKLLWSSMRSNDCRDSFAADGEKNFFPRSCCEEHFRHDQRTPGLFKEEYRGSEMVALCSKTFCGFCSRTNTVKISCKGVNHNAIINDDPLDKYRNVLMHKQIIECINRGFRVVSNSKVCTYELKKNGLSYFYPKRKVANDGIHSEPLDI